MWYEMGTVERSDGAINSTYISLVYGPCLTFDKPTQGHHTARVCETLRADTRLCRSAWSSGPSNLEQAHTRSWRSSLLMIVLLIDVEVLLALAVPAPKALWLALLQEHGLLLIYPPNHRHYACSNLYESCIEYGVLSMYIHHVLFTLT